MSVTPRQNTTATAGVNKTESCVNHPVKTRHSRQGQSHRLWTPINFLIAASPSAVPVKASNRWGRNLMIHPSPFSQRRHVTYFLTLPEIIIWAVYRYVKFIAATLKIQSAGLQRQLLRHLCIRVLHKKHGETMWSNVTLTAARFTPEVTSSKQRQPFLSVDLNEVSSPARLLDSSSVPSLCEILRAIQSFILWDILDFTAEVNIQNNQQCNAIQYNTILCSLPCGFSG